jgi:energy-coupling factor transporter ATP-binding protein EcfA2
MNNKINSLEISNFRSFDNLKVDGIGGVTLVTGKNNTGKSTLLEAIRLLVTEGAPSTFFSILNYREETDPKQDYDNGINFTPEDYTGFCSLFSRFPTLAECKQAFAIRADGHGAPNSSRSLIASIDWFMEEITEQGRRLAKSSEDLWGETPGFPALEIEMPNRKRIIRLERVSRYRRYPVDPSELTTSACVYLDPFSSRSTSQLSSLWDAVALTEMERHVVEALKLVDQNIEAVSMVGSEGGGRPRTAIVKSQSWPHPVPLRSFGDGMNRLFGLMLSICCAKNGFLLVDEFENGLHHTVLCDVWETIFKLSKKLNVQVIATSHSRDCIDAFQRASRKSNGGGSLIRLARHGDTILSSVFGESELAIATRDQIELR